MLGCSVDAFWPAQTNRVLRYGSALVAVAAAMGIRLALETWFGPGLPAYITFFPTIMSVALLAGFGPGLLATVAASLTVAYWVLPPAGQFSIASSIEQVALAIFFVMGIFMSGMAELFRRCRSKAAAYDRAAVLRAGKEELRASEERWRHALEISGLGTWEFDLVHRCAWRTQRHDQIFGYATPLPEWTYETFLQHVLEEDRASVDQCIQSAISERRDWTFACRIRRADGLLRWIWAYGKCVGETDGDPTRIFGVVADITERNEVEEKLRRSEALYRSIGESINYGVWVCDADGRNTYASESFLKMVGITQQQCSDFGWGDVLHPDDAAATISAWQECVRTGGKWNREHRFRGADGEWHYVLARGVPVKDEQGNLVCWAGINLDISDLKRTGEDLRAAKEIAERANKAKSRFIAAASHDLRQPLAALSLYTKTFKDIAPPSMQTLASGISDCVTDLSSLLNDMLDLSKLEAGVIKPQICAFSVFELLANLESVYSQVAQAKGLRLCFVPTRLTGLSDPLLFKRIVGNFIDNAIRYTPRGGVVIGCRRREGKIFIEVWDSGIGIAADQTASIFEEFRQLGDQARNQGSGLGLAIVAKTAPLLDLEIRVSSWPGHGSVFAIELPLGNPETIPGPMQPAGLGQPLRIALVEDNPLVRAALTVALQRHGHQVIAAANGSTLLVGLSQQRPDIIISDYRLTHGETGYDVITAVRQAFGPELRAIIITGDTDPKLIASMSQKEIAVLHKPFEIDQLLACLEELMTQAI